MRHALITGCVYGNKFDPDFTRLYFDFGGSYLELFNECDDIDILVRIVEKITYNPENSEEDVPEAICSLMGMFYYEKVGEENYVTGIDVVVASEEDYTEGRVKSIGFEIDGGSYIFLDPDWFLGMRVGKEKERQQWQETYLNRRGDWYGKDYKEKRWRKSQK